MSKRFFIRLGYQVTELNDSFKHSLPIEFNIASYKLKTRVRQPPWDEQILKEMAQDICRYINEETILNLLKALQEKT